MWDQNAARCVALDSPITNLVDNASMVRYIALTQIDSYIGVALK